MWCALRGPPLLGTILDEEFLDCNTTGRITSSASGIGVDCRLMNAHEALRRASRLTADVAAERIQLPSQAPSLALASHVARGVLFNACSLHQLDELGCIARGGEVSVRMNAGLGSGSTKRTNTGGPASSFGIWHEDLGEVKALAERHGLRINRLHSHIGSGTDPEVWKRCARMTLDLVAQLPEVG